MAGRGLGFSGRGGAVLRDNAYEGVVVAVAEDVAEHPNIVPNLKVNKQVTSGDLMDKNDGKRTIMTLSLYSERRRLLAEIIQLFGGGRAKKLRKEEDIFMLKYCLGRQYLGSQYS